MIKRIFAQSRHSKQFQRMLPTSLTFANACLGLLSIIQSLEDNPVGAAYCILFAAMMDFFDGRIARFFGVESKIGTELDSLCDAISFALAPAVMLYSWTVHDFGILGVVILAVYLCAGLFRLAKYNLTTTTQQYNFIGLPTPIAAFFVTSLVMYQEWLESNRMGFVTTKIGLIFLIAIIAYLMVSKIVFPAFKKPDARLRLTWYSALLIGALGFYGLYLGYPLFMFMQFIYLVYTFSRCIYGKFN